MMSRFVWETVYARDGFVVFRTEASGGQFHVHPDDIREVTDSEGTYARTATGDKHYVSTVGVPEIIRAVADAIKQRRKDF